MGSVQTTFLSAYSMHGDEKGGINASDGKILELEGVNNNDLEKIIIETRTVEELRERLAGVGVNERTEDGHIITRDIGDNGTKIFTKVGSITTRGKLDESIKAEIEAIGDRDVTAITKIIETLEAHGFKRDSLEIQAELDGRNIENESNFEYDMVSQSAQAAVRGAGDIREGQDPGATLSEGEEEEISLSERQRLEEQYALGRRDSRNNEYER